ncbi:MAG: hypothetical protein IJV61_03280 [Paludibacteraceae bacterium]|nr:hypothetical protein [Paludibacteraceae bacterium]
MANESVIIVQVLTGSSDYQQACKYWKVLKGRLFKEGNESVTNCYQLKLPSSDGKKYMTDVADLQGIFRIIQSIPSKKAAAIWLGQIKMMIIMQRHPLQVRQFYMSLLKRGWMYKGQ